MPGILFEFLLFIFFQDPAGIFELVELVGNGTYGQVYKVSTLSLCVAYVWFQFMNGELQCYLYLLINGS